MHLQRIIGILQNLTQAAPESRRYATAWPRLGIWTCSGLTPAIPSMFEARFYLLLQGAKRLVFGARQFDYQGGDYSVSSIGLPFTCQVLQASPEQPYLGLELAIDQELLSRLLLERPDLLDGAPPDWAVERADLQLLEPLERLVRLLESPEDLDTLAPMVERELYYRLLRGPLGGNLRRMLRGSGQFSQVQTAVERIRSQPQRSISTEELAALAGMSVTSFHRHFKAATDLSPLAYQQHVRLLEARHLLAGGTHNVTEVAFAIGYASSSQFSREYKRMFGSPPQRDLNKGLAAPTQKGPRL